jgi:general secretion pathway protein D
VLGPAEYRSVIYALDNSDGVDTIFAPKVTVLNGQRAEIKDVIRIRYNKTIEEAEDQDIDVGDVFSVVYDYAVTPKDWENREYGTRLIVTPSVQTDERTIELDVQPEVSDLDGFRRFVSSRNNEYRLPQFFVQSVKTVVTVNDGDTLVMGGLTKESVVRTMDKTPILGDLPLIGRYWRGESEVAKKSNLLIFINAKLVDPAGKTRRQTRTTAAR